MREWKGSDISEPMASFGLSRLGKLRIWFLLLVVFALGIAVGTLIKVIPEARDGLEMILSDGNAPPVESFLGISQAFAQDGVLSVGFTDMKPIITAAIIGCLIVVFLIAFSVMLYSDNSQRVTTAGDAVKTLLGFFIGVGTQFFAI